MSVTINGTTGVSLVQNGVLTDANMPSGSVIQVVSATYATEVTVSTTTYTDSGLSASITPSSASSKIIVLVSQPITTYIASGGVYNYTKYKLVRNSTDIITNEYGISIEAGASSNSNISTSSTLAISYLDSPATTSSVTYKTQIAPLRTVNSGQSKAQNGNSTASIVLLEVAA